jgi:Pectate lyase superfamily protein
LSLQPFTAVPASRAGGEGNPPADMNNTALQLLALNSSYSVMNAAYSGGADPTGSADSTNAFQAALDTGIATIPPGTYKIDGNLTAAPPIVIAGAGKDQVTINFTGSGDCLRINTTGAESGFARAILTGFTIDGTDASAGASGLHMGDVYQSHLDIAINKFQGSGSKNFWFDNQYNYTEQTTGRIYARAGTANVVFDNSANPNGTADNSFDRTILDIFIDSDGVGDGVVFQNGALMFDGRLGIYGNFTEGTSQYAVLRLAASTSYSFTATHASPCVFTAAGSYYSDGTLVTLSGGSLPGGFTATTYFVVNASGATFELSATSGGSAIDSTSTGSGDVVGYQQSSILQSVLNIGVELDPGGPGSTAPYTIFFGTEIKTVIAGCTGIMDFGASETFANASGYFLCFQFDGPVFGDTLLFRTHGGAVPVNYGGVFSDGQTINPVADVVMITPSSNLTGMVLNKWQSILGTASACTIVNRSTTYSITFAASGTSNVATGTSCVIPPSTSMAFIWDEYDNLWSPPVTALPLVLQESTGTTGYTLVNGTGTIITWTPPSDGGLHRFTIFAGMHVTSTETGGQITANYTLPDGTATDHTVFAAGLGSGDDTVAQNFSLTVKAGTAVSVEQATALSGGAAIMWAEIWGA